MRDCLVLMAHLIVTIIRTMARRGARAVIAESLLLKHQLLVLNRSRKKAPPLRAPDRILFGLATSLGPPLGAPKGARSPPGPGRYCGFTERWSTFRGGGCARAC